jgi:hypothetical protein
MRKAGNFPQKVLIPSGAAIYGTRGQSLDLKIRKVAAYKVQKHDPEINVSYSILLKLVLRTSPLEHRPPSELQKLLRSSLRYAYINQTNLPPL